MIYLFFIQILILFLLAQESCPDPGLLEIDLDRAIQDRVDADRPAKQGMEVVARSHHDELTGLSLCGYPFSSKAEETVIPPGRFVNDKCLRFFVHSDGDFVTTKISEYRKNFNNRETSVSISISVIPKSFISAFRNGFASVKIFYAISSPPFSAAAELRTLTPNLFHPSLCSHACPQLESFSQVVLNTASPSLSDSLEVRIVKAKSSMVASTIPKSPIYHGNRDAYVWPVFFDITL